MVGNAPGEAHGGRCAASMARQSCLSCGTLTPPQGPMRAICGSHAILWPLCANAYQLRASMHRACPSGLNQTAKDPAELNARHSAHRRGVLAEPTVAAPQAGEQSRQVRTRHYLCRPVGHRAVAPRARPVAPDVGHQRSQYRAITASWGGLALEPDSRLAEHGWALIWSHSRRAVALRRAPVDRSVSGGPGSVAAEPWWGRACAGSIGAWRAVLGRHELIRGRRFRGGAPALQTPR